MTERKHDGSKCGAGHLGAVDHGDEIGPCPSCGAPIHVSTVQHPHTGRPTEILLHEIPFCSYFGATDPDAIIQDLLANAGLS